MPNDKPSQTTLEDIQAQITALNEQIRQPDSDVHALNQKIRDLIAQQTEIRTNALRDTNV